MDWGKGYGNCEVWPRAPARPYINKAKSKRFLAKRHHSLNHRACFVQLHFAGEARLYIRQSPGNARVLQSPARDLQSELPDVHAFEPVHAHVVFREPLAAALDDVIHTPVRTECIGGRCDRYEKAQQFRARGRGSWRFRVFHPLVFCVGGVRLSPGLRLVLRSSALAGRVKCIDSQHTKLRARA